MTGSGDPKTLVSIEAEYQTFARSLAATVRTLRKRRGWLLRDLERETGVKIGMLAPTERGDVSMTISRLSKIAFAFRMRPSQLLQLAQVAR